MTWKYGKSKGKPSQADKEAAHGTFLRERAGGKHGAGTTRSTAEINAAAPTTAAEKSGAKARRQGQKRVRTYGSGGSKPKSGK